MNWITVFDALCMHAEGKKRMSDWLVSYDIVSRLQTENRNIATHVSLLTLLVIYQTTIKYGITKSRSGCQFIIHVCMYVCLGLWLRVCANVTLTCHIYVDSQKNATFKKYFHEPRKLYFEGLIYVYIIQF